MLWRVSIATKPERREKKSRVHEYLVVSDDKDKATALGFVFSHLDPEKVLRITTEPWGIVASSDNYLSANLDTKPESLPTAVAVAEAMRFLGEADE